MTVQEAISMKESGQKIPDSDWKRFTSREKSEIMKSSKPKGGGKGHDKEGIPWRNDYRFYALSEQIAKDLGSIAYNIIPGVGHDIHIQVGGASVSNKTLVDNKEQSICVLKYINTCGVATQRTDGVNMAATQLYTYIRRANSGARNYEAADVMMYILAMREVYAEFFEAKRALGIANLYVFENHNLPDLLLHAININPSDLRANIATYRGRLNVLAKKINALAVPSYFKMFERTAYIASKVFADSTSIRGQFYVFQRSGYYLWSPISSEKGSALEFNRVDNQISFAQKLSNLERMLDALFLDDDINTMSGDILKAFGSEKCYQVVDTTEDYTVLPQYDEDILAQIENSYAYASANGGTLYPDSAFTITQTEQLITFQPTGSNSVVSKINVTDKAFNSHKDLPQYSDNLEWSRLITICEISAGDAADTSFTGVVSCGQELLERYALVKYGVGGTPTTNFFYNVIGAVSNATGGNNNLGILSAVMQFDWHPIIYFFTVNEQTITVGGDLKKYTFIADEIWTPVHNQAVTAALWADDLYRVNTGKSQS